MAKLFPFRREGPELDQRPKLVGIDDDGADQVFAALSSETARTILERLYEEPATATDVAEAADTSLQNARYHIDKLVDAGLIEAVDTWYSSRGTEMTVYAPTNAPLVLAAGQDEHTSVLKQALGRLVGAVAVLGLASALLDRLLVRYGGIRSYDSEGGVFLDRDDGGTETAIEEMTVVKTQSGDTVRVAGTERAGQTSTPMVEAASTGSTPTPTVARTNGSPATAGPTAGGDQATQVVERTAVDATSSAVPDTATQADPGLVTGLADGLAPGTTFFAGGLAVLLIVSAWWYLRYYRPLYGG